jgi:flagellar motor switch protein FliG
MYHIKHAQDFVKRVATTRHLSPDAIRNLSMSYSTSFKEEKEEKKKRRRAL